MRGGQPKWQSRGQISCPQVGDRTLATRGDLHCAATILTSHRRSPNSRPLRPWDRKHIPISTPTKTSLQFSSPCRQRKTPLAPTAFRGMCRSPHQRWWARPTCPRHTRSNESCQRPVFRARLRWLHSQAAIACFSSRNRRCTNHPKSCECVTTQTASSRRRSSTWMIPISNSAPYTIQSCSIPRLPKTVTSTSAVTVLAGQAS